MGESNQSRLKAGVITLYVMLISWVFCMICGIAVLFNSDLPVERAAGVALMGTANLAPVFINIFVKNVNNHKYKKNDSLGVDGNE